VLQEKAFVRVLFKKRAHGKNCLHVRAKCTIAQPSLHIHPTRQISKPNTYLSKARVRTILDPQTLHDGHKCERASSRLVTALVVTCTRTNKQTDEQRGDRFVVDVVDT
jgi:hypothetical protein